MSSLGVNCDHFEFTKSGLPQSYLEIPVALLFLIRDTYNLGKQVPITRTHFIKKTKTSEPCNLFFEDVEGHHMDNIAFISQKPQFFVTTAPHRFVPVRGLPWLYSHLARKITRVLFCFCCRARFRTLRFSMCELFDEIFSPRLKEIVIFASFYRVGKQTCEFLGETLNYVFCLFSKFLDHILDISVDELINYVIFFSPYFGVNMVFSFS